MQKETATTSLVNGGSEFKNRQSSCQTHSSQTDLHIRMNMWLDAWLQGLCLPSVTMVPLVLHTVKHTLPVSMLIGLDESHRAWVSSPDCIQEKPDEHKTWPLKSEEEVKFQIGSNRTATFNCWCFAGQEGLNDRKTFENCWRYYTILLETQQVQSLKFGKTKYKIK